jgi:hypothetical protein
LTIGYLDGLGLSSLESAQLVIERERERGRERERERERERGRERERERRPSFLPCPL